MSRSLQNHHLRVEKRAEKRGEGRVEKRAEKRGEGRVKKREGNYYKLHCREYMSLTFGITNDVQCEYMYLCVCW